ncbi:hypothetical protein HDU96_008436 [Phlyctochytrium bullatum]|nr:hypothetical protein HDU96_008436 [Phlyctochytrium bullatum]
MDFGAGEAIDRRPSAQRRTASSRYLKLPSQRKQQAEGSMPGTRRQPPAGDAAKTVMADAVVDEDTQFRIDLEIAKKAVLCGAPMRPKCIGRYGVHLYYDPKCMPIGKVRDGASSVPKLLSRTSSLSNVVAATGSTVSFTAKPTDSQLGSNVGRPAGATGQVGEKSAQTNAKRKAEDAIKEKTIDVSAATPQKVQPFAEKEGDSVVEASSEPSRSIKRLKVSKGDPHGKVATAARASAAEPTVSQKPPLPPEKNSSQIKDNIAGPTEKTHTSDFEESVRVKLEIDTETTQADLKPNLATSSRPKAKPARPPSFTRASSTPSLTSVASAPVHGIEPASSPFGISGIVTTSPTSRKRTRTDFSIVLQRQQTEMIRRPSSFNKSISDLSSNNLRHELRDLGSGKSPSKAGTNGLGTILFDPKDKEATAGSPATVLGKRPRNESPKKETKHAKAELSKQSSHTGPSNGALSVDEGSSTSDVDSISNAGSISRPSEAEPKKPEEETRDLSSSSAVKAKRSLLTNVQLPASDRESVSLKELKTSTVPGRRVPKMDVRDEDLQNESLSQSSAIWKEDAVNDHPQKSLRSQSENQKPPGPSQESPEEAEFWRSAGDGPLDREELILKKIPEQEEPEEPAGPIDLLENRTTAPPRVVSTVTKQLSSTIVAAVQDEVKPSRTPSKFKSSTSVSLQRSLSASPVTKAGTVIRDPIFKSKSALAVFNSPSANRSEQSLETAQALLQFGLFKDDALRPATKETDDGAAVEANSQPKPDVVSILPSLQKSSSRNTILDETLTQVDAFSDTMTQGPSLPTVAEPPPPLTCADEAEDHPAADSQSAAEKTDAASSQNEGESSAPSSRAQQRLSRSTRASVASQAESESVLQELPPVAAGRSPADLTEKDLSPSNRRVAAMDTLPLEKKPSAAGSQRKELASGDRPSIPAVPKLAAEQAKNEPGTLSAETLPILDHQGSSASTPTRAPSLYGQRSTRSSDANHIGSQNDKAAETASSQPSKPQAKDMSSAASSFSSVPAFQRIASSVPFSKGTPISPNVLDESGNFSVKTRPAASIASESPWEESKSVADREVAFNSKTPATPIRASQSTPPISSPSQRAKSGSQVDKSFKGSTGKAVRTSKSTGSSQNQANDVDGPPGVENRVLPTPSETRGKRKTGKADEMLAESMEAFGGDVGDTGEELELNSPTIERARRPSTEEPTLLLSQEPSQEAVRSANAREKTPASVSNAESLPLPLTQPRTPQREPTPAAIVTAPAVQVPLTAVSTDNGPGIGSSFRVPSLVATTTASSSGTAATTVSPQRPAVRPGGGVRVGSPAQPSQLEVAIAAAPAPNDTTARKVTRTNLNPGSTTRTSRRWQDRAPEIPRADEEGSSGAKTGVSGYAAQNHLTQVLLRLRRESGSEGSRDRSSDGDSTTSPVVSATGSNGKDVAAAEPNNSAVGEASSEEKSQIPAAKADSNGDETKETDGPLGEDDEVIESTVAISDFGGNGNDGTFRWHRWRRNGSRAVGTPSQENISPGERQPPPLPVDSNVNSASDLTAPLHALDPIDEDATQALIHVDGVVTEEIEGRHVSPPLHESAAADDSETEDEREEEPATRAVVADEAVATLPAVNEDNGDAGDRDDDEFLMNSLNPWEDLDARHRKKHSIAGSQRSSNAAGAEAAREEKPSTSATAAAFPPSSQATKAAALPPSSQATKVNGGDIRPSLGGSKGPATVRTASIKSGMGGRIFGFDSGSFAESDEDDEPLTAITGGKGIYRPQLENPFSAKGTTATTSDKAPETPLVIGGLKLPKIGAGGVASKPARKSVKEMFEFGSDDEDLAASLHTDVTASVAAPASASVPPTDHAAETKSPGAKETKASPKAVKEAPKPAFKQTGQTAMSLLSNVLGDSPAKPLQALALSFDSPNPPARPKSLEFITNDAYLDEEDPAFPSTPSKSPATTTKVVLLRRTSDPKGMSSTAGTLFTSTAKRPTGSKPFPQSDNDDDAADNEPGSPGDATLPLENTPASTARRRSSLSSSSVSAALRGSTSKTPLNTKPSPRGRTTSSSRSEVQKAPTTPSRSRTEKRVGRPATARRTSPVPPGSAGLALEESQGFGGGRGGSGIGNGGPSVAMAEVHPAPARAPPMSIKKTQSEMVMEDIMDFLDKDIDVLKRMGLFEVE